MKTEDKIKELEEQVAELMELLELCQIELGKKSEKQKKGSKTKTKLLHDFAYYYRKVKKQDAKIKELKGISMINSNGETIKPLELLKKQEAKIKELEEQVAERDKRIQELNEADQYGELSD